MSNKTVQCCVSSWYWLQFFLCIACYDCNKTHHLSAAAGDGLCRVPVCLCVISFRKQDISKTSLSIVATFLADISYILRLRKFNRWCRSHQGWLTFSHFSFSRKIGYRLYVYLSVTFSYSFARGRHYDHDCW